MADYYTQFCVDLELLTPEEHQWWKRVLDVDWAAPKSAGVGPNVEKVILDAIEDGVEDWLFEYELRQDSVIFHHGDAFDELVKLVHYFFKEMRPEGDDTFILFWASTCSKPRPDEFQGGTVAVTKKGIGYCGPDDQMTMAMNNIKEVE